MSRIPGTPDGRERVAFRGPDGRARLIEAAETISALVEIDG